MDGLRNLARGSCLRGRSTKHSQRHISLNDLAGNTVCALQGVVDKRKHAGKGSKLFHKRTSPSPLLQDPLLPLAPPTTPHRVEDPDDLCTVWKLTESARARARPAHAQSLWRTEKMREIEKMHTERVYIRIYVYGASGNEQSAVMFVLLLYRTGDVHRADADDVLSPSNYIRRAGARRETR